MLNFKHGLLATLASTLPISAAHATAQLPIVRVRIGDLNLAISASVSVL
jgi:hypothetical protein